jgi:GT2 family glycosyltransferase
MTDGAPGASVIVCTYRRDQVLIDTIGALLPLVRLAHAELIVVDQLARHTPEVARQLEAWSQGGDIRYVNLDRSGLTHARNVGAGLAWGDVLIYFDDDIIPAARVIIAHLANYREADVACVAGQVLNPGEPACDAPGSFSHDAPIEQFQLIYGANFSMRRRVYNAIGGSDENLGVHSYTEDQVLSRRLVTGGFRIRYDPAASVVHLLHSSGGCRLTDRGQPTRERDKSFSKLYWWFMARHLPSGARRRLFWEAIRHGPLRRENVLRPWRQPTALWEFCAAIIDARRRASAADSRGK